MEFLYWLLRLWSTNGVWHLSHYSRKGPKWWVEPNFLAQIKQPICGIIFVRQIITAIIGRGGTEMGLNLPFKNWGITFGYSSFLQFYWCLCSVQGSQRTNLRNLTWHWMDHDTNIFLFFSFSVFIDVCIIRGSEVVL